MVGSLNVDASVTWESYGPIATCTDSVRTFTYADDITDDYGCEYGDMETRQHNFDGSDFFLRIRIRIRTKGDIASDISNPINSI